ncbi:MAG TPA: hypothetical protein VER12_03335 [Polyangiaceae bacterium]|nr:hypothetical protein [Polyangiaceae bacterium]
MSDIASYLLIVGRVVAGFVWGKISSRLPIPELFRLLTTPLCTGALTVVVGRCISVTRLDWSAARVVEAAKLGGAAVLGLAIGYSCICFLVGAVLGLPATLGWVIGYRQMTKG